MKRLMWPGLLIVLLGSLAALHAVTLVLALSGPVPRARPAAAEDAPRPRSGWHVELAAVPAGDGLLRLELRLADAGAQPIADAEVSLRLAQAVVPLAHREQGRYEGLFAGTAPDGLACRVQVSRAAHTWTFDRILQVRGAGP